MPIIKFDYFANPHIYNKKLDAIYTPIIPIKISANYKLYPNTIDCLIDSGADFNLMPAAIGEYLGLQIKKGKKITHMGIGNVGLTAYAHQVKIFISNYNFKTDIHFSYDHRIPLLGRHGFFKYFKRVTFNEKKLQIELEY